MKDFYLKLLKHKLKKEVTAEEQILQNINYALSQLNYARSTFDMVVGADNIELAILELNTAEKRYQNLIKEAKRLGITKFAPGALSPRPPVNKIIMEIPLEQS